MNIKALMEGMPFSYKIIGDQDTDVLSLCTNSRKAEKNCMFFCIRGLHSDAHDYADKAVQAGACALVVERVLPVNCVQILVPDVRLALSYIAANFYENPAKKLKIYGITGTKGKTTTSYMLKAILEKAGHKVGLIGTVCTLIGDRQKNADKTTPDPVEFQATLREMLDEGVDAVVMEVSAHALVMHRVAGIHFVAAGFTNLSQDHLDYFGTMENYLKAKLTILNMADHVAVNVDDERVARACVESKVPFTRVGIREKADVYARGTEFEENGLRFKLFFHKILEKEITLQMTGIFNVYNALMASALAYLGGADAEAIQAGLRSVKSVPGRIELLETGTPYRVILDYAHSPDALENILTTVRQTTKGRLIVVFGCGGGRDHGKRPIMGEIAGRLADYSIITSDNPRDEEPMSIISAIEEGIVPTQGKYVIIENRREAIRHALGMAVKTDAVVLAGKGHETYQEICGVKYPFDEKVVVQELLSDMRKLSAED